MGSGLRRNTLSRRPAGDRETHQLQQDRSIDYIVSLGASYALTAVQSVSEAGSKAKIATFDLNKDLTGAISNGTIQFAVDQQPYLQGYLAIECCGCTRPTATTWAAVSSRS
jgi:ABC-type sugar transport system substrate-binding protein